MEPDFTNGYIVFAHGARLVTKKSNSFKLGPNYRLVTLHIPGESININLSKIILEQIDSKMDLINNLFIISCPIARESVKEKLENSFIIDWLLNSHKGTFKKSKLIEDLKLLGVFDDEVNVRNVAELKLFVESFNFKEIKEHLGFEIRTYRPNDLAPKILLQFNFSTKQTNINSGIFRSDAFRDFNFDESDEESFIGSISTGFQASSPIKSLVDFKSNNYYLDNSDIKDPGDKSFFDTINPSIKSGLIVILSCGCYKGKSFKISTSLREASVERQKQRYETKYIINYN